MTGRQCVKCGTINDPTALSCRRCGTFFKQKGAPREHKSIWELQRERMTGIVSSDADTSAAVPSKVPQWIAVCPLCGVRIPLVGKEMPLMCDCGYYFQSYDRPVSSDGSDGQNEPPTKRSQSADSPPVKESPLRRAKPQPQTLLRLISCTDRLPFVLDVKPPRGGVFGKGGNLRPPLSGGAFTSIADERFDVFFTDTGWYFRALAGLTLYNGEPVSIGSSISLCHGDLINPGGSCPIRVEIAQFG